MDRFILCKVRFAGEDKNMTGYMTLKEASEKWGVCARRINTLCVDGRIEGLINWVICGCFLQMRRNPKTNVLKLVNI